MTNIRVFHDEMNQEFAMWASDYEDQRNQFGLNDYRILLEGYQKIAGGIKHLVRNYQQFDTARYQQDIQEQGVFSARPYQLTQACDASVNSCILALYEDFCLSKQLNPKSLFQMAYPESEFKLPDFSANKQFADWQGVVYPEIWDKSTYLDLLENLDEIHYNELVHVLEKIIDIPDHQPDLYEEPDTLEED